MGIFDTFKSVTNAVSDIVENPGKSFNRIKTEIVSPTFSTIKRVPGGALLLNQAARLSQPYLGQIRDVQNVLNTFGDVPVLGDMVGMSGAAVDTLGGINEMAAQAEEQSGFIKDLQNAVNTVGQVYDGFNEIRNTYRRSQPQAPKRPAPRPMQAPPLRKQPTYTRKR